jgi:hypothetical protein
VGAAQGGTVLRLLGDVPAAAATVNCVRVRFACADDGEARVVEGAVEEGAIVCTSPVFEHDANLFETSVSIALNGADFSDAPLSFLYGGKGAKAEKKGGKK